MKLLYLLPLFFLIALARAESFSQDKPRDNNSKKNLPIEVKLNLMVLDANDAFVEDLKIEEVKLFEDGVEQKLTGLTRMRPGVDVALVVDNTGSMRSQLKIVREAAALLAVNLGQSDEAQVIRFTHSADIQILQDWTPDRAKVLAAIRDRLFIEGGQSAVIDAIYLAVESIKQRKRSGPLDRSAVVLISDGDERGSFYKQKQLFKFLEGTNIQIYTIALTSELDSRGGFQRDKSTKRAAEELVKTLGGLTGGHAYIVDKAAEDGLKNAMRSIMIELRSQYVVSYIPTSQKRDSMRKLRVEVAPGSKGEKRQAFLRESNYIPDN